MSRSELPNLEDQFMFVVNLRKNKNKQTHRKKQATSLFI